jgi:polyisoprenoid-binding protein YceI
MRMMRCAKAFVVAAIVCVAQQAPPGSAAERLIDIDRSTVTVRVFKAGLFRVFADDHIIRASLSEGSLDPDIPHVQVVIDARRLQVLDPGLSSKDRQDVQARMLGPEVLDVDRFQRISFHSLAARRLDTGEWLVQGELELRGQIRAISLNVVSVDDHYKGSATVRQSDFGISPISILGGSVKVKDEVTIEFDIALQPAANVS